MRQLPQILYYGAQTNIVFRYYIGQSIEELTIVTSSQQNWNWHFFKRSTSWTSYVFPIFIYFPKKGFIFFHFHRRDFNIKSHEESYPFSGSSGNNISLVIHHGSREYQITFSIQQTVRDVSYLDSFMKEILALIWT